MVSAEAVGTRFPVVTQVVGAKDGTGSKAAMRLPSQGVVFQHPKGLSFAPGTPVGLPGEAVTPLTIQPL